MDLQRRIAATLALGVVALVALVFVGTKVSNCLGPLGRTHVQSLADGCASLYADPATLVGPAFLVVAVLIWFSPRSADVRSAILGALVGAAVGPAIYAGVRSTSITGPTSYGDVITVALPFDCVAAATAAIVAGSAGWILVCSLARIRGMLAGS